MTRHPLDGNAIAADKHYGRDEPEMRECDQCDGEGWVWGHEMADPPDVPQPDDTRYTCDVCHGSGEVPVEHEEPEAQERDE